MKGEDLHLPITAHSYNRRTPAPLALVWAAAAALCALLLAIRALEHLLAHRGVLDHGALLVWVGAPAAGCIVGVLTSWAWVGLSPQNRSLLRVTLPASAFGLLAFWMVRTRAFVFLNMIEPWDLSAPLCCSLIAALVSLRRRALVASK